MAVTGCSQCIKYMLFFLNFIFWLAGGVILGVALWLRHDSQTSNLLMLQFEGSQAPGTFHIIGAYILIGIGSLSMLMGFLGCIGAIYEVRCLLGLVSDLWNLVYIKTETKPFTQNTYLTQAVSLEYESDTGSISVTLIYLTQVLSISDHP
uniref:CD81 molecule b n=1 Tax=Sinocyclocheilus grahami TaxID=75366 RepID=A0A672N1L4_SINGR